MESLDYLLLWLVGGLTGLLLDKIYSRVTNSQFTPLLAFVANILVPVILLTLWVINSLTGYFKYNADKFKDM